MTMVSMRTVTNVAHLWMAHTEEQAQCAEVPQTCARFGTFYARCICMLAAIQKNGHLFLWKPMHQVCMDNIKVLACKVPILCPIDPSGDNPIWVICDASASGIGAAYGQGPDWKSCRPAGFMSKKFTAAQHNYHVFEMVTIPYP